MTLSILTHMFAVAIVAMPIVLVGKAFFIASGRIVEYLDGTFLDDSNPAASRNAAWLVHLTGFLFVFSVVLLGTANAVSGLFLSLLLILGAVFLALCGTRLYGRLDKFLFDT